MDTAKKNWRTTVAGVGQFLAVLGPALAAQFDGDPATAPLWGAVLTSGAVMLGFVVAGDQSTKA